MVHDAWCERGNEGAKIWSECARFTISMPRQTKLMMVQIQTCDGSNFNGSRFASAVMPYGMFGERPPEPEEDGAKSTASGSRGGSLMHSMAGVSASMRGVSGRDASLAGTMKVRRFVDPDLKPCFETRI